MDEKDAALKLLPVAVDVIAGETYHWCGCEQSSTQPFCDQKNCKDAVVYQAIVSETVFFCQCKQTSDPPFCDGSHSSLLLEFVKKNKLKT